MPNAWINHVKEYASKNNLKYGDALKSPDCKSSYSKTGNGIPPNYGKTQSAERLVLNMTRYGKPGTFTREDVARINKEDKERKEMRNKVGVNSVSY